MAGLRGVPYNLLVETAILKQVCTSCFGLIKSFCTLLRQDIRYCTVLYRLLTEERYRRILGVRYLSNRLTSASGPNTNKTYGGKSSYAMYFMPYIVDSVVGFINDENMAPRDVSAPNGAQ